MSGHSQRIAELSGERRQLLTQLLQKRGHQYKVFPLSFAQQRMWFLYQAEPDQPFYNVALKLIFKGELVASVLQQAIGEIIRRHEVLRTAFAVINGNPMQVISAPEPATMPVIDLSGIAEPEREAQVRHLAGKEARRPFDLERGPMLRTVLLRLATREHVLLLCTHHIVVDGWAIGVLLRELASLYEAYLAHLPSPLPPLVIQYADYAQQQLSSGEVHETQLAYWKKQLRGSQHVLNLPTDRPRPAVQTYRGAHQTLAFSKELTESLKSLSQKEGVTLFMLLLAGYQALLYRYTGQTDISLGTPVSGRNRAETESLIGLFSNTLVMRSELSGELSFHELLGRVRETCLGAYGHQEFPFDKLVENLQPERDPGRHPLVQVTFSLQNETLATQGSGKALSFPGLALSIEGIDTGTVQFDLILTIENKHEMVASLSYNEDLFDVERIKRMLGHYQRLLESVVAAPLTSIAKLPLLSSEEVRSLFRQGNGPHTEFPDVSLPQLFETQAALTPSAPAICFGDRTLTFEQLNSRANQMARYLHQLGIGPGALVGLCLNRSTELVVSLLGILKAGATVVPLAPTAARRLESSLKGLQLSALIAENSIAAELETQPLPVGRQSSSALTILCPDAHRERINKQSTDALTQVVSPESAAYLLPSATADCSAISVAHRTVQNRLRWLQDTCALKSGEAVLHRSSLDVDVSVWELLWPLLYGGRLILCAARESDFASACAVAAKHQVKIMRVVASEMRHWVLQTAVNGKATSQVPRSLRWVICSGEQVDEATIQAWQQISSAAVCQSHSVPGTEALAVIFGSDDAVLTPEKARVPLSEKALEVSGPAAQAGVTGYPINNVAIVVLNEAGELAPAGVSGEVWVGGKALDGVRLFEPLAPSVVFDATFNQNSETRAAPGSALSSGSRLRRIRNSFAEISGSHLWRTGERGCWLADGRLRLEGCVGHAWIDDRRVAFEEVEAALLVLTNVQDCAVRSRRSQGGNRLVAYVVSSGKFAAEELSAQLSKQLAPHQVPQVYLQIPALPLTAKGAVDETALASVPLIEEAQLGLLEEWLLKVPGIRNAAVVLQEVVESLPTLHVSDLVADTRLPEIKMSRTEEVRDSVGQEQPGRRGDVAIVETQAESAAGEMQSEHEGLAFPDRGPMQSEVALPKTLSEMLQRAVQESEQGVTYVSNGQASQQSYGQLLERANKVCGWLTNAGGQAEQLVILQLENNEEFLAGFWGCVVGRMVPVPLATSASYEHESSGRRLLENVWEMLEGPLVVTNRSRVAEIRGVLEGRSSGREVRVIGIEEAAEAEVEAQKSERVVSGAGASAAAEPGPAAGEQDLALLLFTSGSTGKPKGVMLTHRNIASMCGGIAELNGYNEKDVSLNWMPLTHVGGLVMFHLRDVFLGCRQIQARTEDVLQNPLLWLDLMEKYRASVTWAPNFAFKLINDQAALIQQRGWDLSSVRLIANGGEVVNAQTAMTFLSLLAKDGLEPTAMRPGFGMSETSSSIISSEILALGSERGLQKIHLRSGNQVVRGSDASSRTTTLVEVGIPARGLQVRIVDAGNQLLAADTIGRLQVRGPQVTPGYYKNPEANREAFCDDGWFNTGDLGFLHQDRLTITGREKDVIIVNGVNYYSSEIEARVEEIEGVEVSYSAACAVRDSFSDTDKLAIFFHPHLQQPSAPMDLIKRIRETIARSVGITPDYVVPLQKSEIPKTAIGKIQRSLLKDRFEQGEFAAIVKEIDLELENTNTLPDWFYQQVWVPKRASHLQAQLDPGIFLVFLDQSGLGAQLCEDLRRAGSGCVAVSAGTDFFRQSATHYRLDPANQQHYRQLIAALRQDEMLPRRVLHLWAYEQEPGTGLEALEEAQQRGFYSLLWLVQALAQAPETLSPSEEEWSPSVVQLDVVTCHAQASRPNTPYAYQHGTLPGLLKSMAAELSWLGVRHLDLDAEATAVNASRLMDELRVIKSDPEISYRAGERLVARLQKTEMLPAERRPLPIRKGGLYLVTGGLGGIGTYLAEYLLKHYETKLLLVGRTLLPGSTPLKTERNLQTKPAGGLANVALERLGRLRVLEAAGASNSCLYRSVDVCDLEGLRRAVQEAEQQWGCPVDGVFHLAGEENLERHWQEMDRYWVAAETSTHVAETLRAKVSGTWTLFELLKEHSRAIFVGFSSVNSIFGAATFGAYSAANSFLDGFANYRREQDEGAQIWNFNWTMWDRLGMSAGGPDYARELARSLGYRVMSAEQGVVSLLAGLSRQPMNVIVGLDGGHEQVRRRLQSRKAATHQVVAFYTSGDSEQTRSALAATMESVPFEKRAPIVYRQVKSLVFRQVKSFARKPNGTIDKEQLQGSGNHDENDRTWTAPQREVESQLLEVWKKVLEVERIGVHDKFFELGGNSLKSLRLLAAVNQRFSCQVAVVDLFKYSTVKTLGSHIEMITANGNGKGEGRIGGFEL